MTEFQVYDHPTRGPTTVKAGFSWPGFFFHVFWLGINQIWLWFWLWTTVVVVGGLLIAYAKSGGVAEEGSRLLVNVAALMNSILHLTCGFQGNKWKREALVNRGYRPSSAVAHDAATECQSIDLPDIRSSNPSHGPAVTRVHGPAGKALGNAHMQRSATAVQPATPSTRFDRVPCPFCAEDIKRAAVICRYCQRDLPAGWAGAASAPDLPAGAPDLRAGLQTVADLLESGQDLLTVVRSIADQAVDRGAGQWDEANGYELEAAAPVPAQLLATATAGVSLLEDVVNTIRGKVSEGPSSIRDRAGYVSYSFALVWTGVAVSLPRERSQALIDHQIDILSEAASQWGLAWSREQIVVGMGSIMQAFNEGPAGAGPRLLNMAKIVLANFVTDAKTVDMAAMEMVVPIAQLLDQGRKISDSIE